jgi:hypothetical protein
MFSSALDQLSEYVIKVEVFLTDHRESAAQFGRYCEKMQVVKNYVYCPGVWEHNGLSDLDQV